LCCGQTIGKVGIVVALRRGGNSRLVRRLRERPRKPAGRFRTRLRAWSDRMLGLLSKRWWGVLIVFLSACVYIPPLYAVTLAVPATRMSVISFGVAVLLGRLLLFLAIAFGASALFNWVSYLITAQLQPCDIDAQTVRSLSAWLTGASCR
jgi:hypothetical protein